MEIYIPSKEELERILTLGPTKLGDFFKCHRILEYKTVFKFKDKGIKAFFGTANHHMTDRFFMLNYKSTDSFVNYWYRYWKMIRLSQEPEITEETVKMILRPKPEEKIDIEKLRKRAEELRKKYGKLIWKYVEERAIPYVWGYYSKAGAGMLRNFYEKHIEEKLGLEERRKVELEKRGLGRLKGKKRKEAVKELELFPQTEIGFEFYWEGYPLKIRIDKIELLGRVLRAIDYKTGKFKPAVNDLVLRRKEDYQSTINTIALEEICNRYGYVNGGFAIYHLRSGEIIPVPRLAHHFDLLLDALKYTTSKIRECEEKRYTSKEPFVYPQNVDYHCQGCDFREVCHEEEEAKHGNKEAVNKIKGRIEKTMRIKRKKKKDYPGQRLLFKNI